MGVGEVTVGSISATTSLHACAKDKMVENGDEQNGEHLQSSGTHVFRSALSQHRPVYFTLAPSQHQGVWPQSTLHDKSHKTQSSWTRQFERVFSKGSCPFQHISNIKYRDRGGWVGGMSGSGWALGSVHCWYKSSITFSLIQ